MARHVWTNVKSSRIHQRRLRYVFPQNATSWLQPLRKTGKQRKSNSMLFWSMQHLSIHTLGSRSCSSTNSALQCCNADHFASASSDQECDTKASHLPNRSGFDRENKSGFGVRSLRSSKLRSHKSMLRKRD